MTAGVREHTPRLDIQGLRALAVLLVICSHLVGWPRGGFLGVDVFFVISGFLITGGLVRAAETRRSPGTFLADFYIKRVRRILPASLLVLAVIVALGTVLVPGRAPGIRTDALWALGFAANVHFAREGTRYFQDQEPPSPVQHYWSLSVEEQYYLVWPALLLGLVVLLHRRRSLLTACTAALTAVSFGLALYQTHHDPIPAYFSTLSRAWELGVGSTLALFCYAHPRFVDSLGIRLRAAIALAGLAGIAASVALVSPEAGFPAPAAALPVLSVAAVLLSGVGGPAPGTSLLTNRLSTYIGDISYSLYLWHWLVVVFTDAMLAGERSWVRIVVSLLATISLSVLSYHLVEQPARRRPVAEPFTNTQARRLLIAMPALLVVAIVLPRATRERPIKPAGTVIVGEPFHVGPDQIAPTAEHARLIDEALAAKTFPDLEPALDALGVDGAMRDIWNSCLVETADVGRACMFGPPPGAGSHTAVVVGDSIAASWAISVGGGLAERGWTTYGFAIGQCPAAFVRVTGKSFTPDMTPRCDQFHREIAGVVARLHPDLLVLSSSSASLKLLASGARDDDAVAEYRDGMIAAVQSMATSATSIVILSPPPIASSLPVCATAGASPRSCRSGVDQPWFSQSAADREAAAKAHVRYLDARLLFCSGANWCPAFIGTTPVRYDGTHMTKAFATVIAPQVADALLREWQRATSAGGPSSP